MKGYLVHTGMNGQEALDAIEVHRPQLIAALIDCEMPVRDVASHSTLPAY
jgi:CheY-like chemotaxis protein